MAQGVPRTALVLILLALTGSWGCARSQPTRYYVLTALATPPAGAQAPAGGKTPVVGVRRVEIPEHLDRQQIVTRAGANEIGISEFDRWGAPLRDELTQVVAENLRALLPTERGGSRPRPA